MSVGRPGDRPLQPVHVGAQRSTGPVDRAAAAADSLLIPCRRRLPRLPLSSYTADPEKIKNGGPYSTKFLK